MPRPYCSANVRPLYPVVAFVAHGGPKRGETLRRIIRCDFLSQVALEFRHTANIIVDGPATVTVAAWAYSHGAQFVADRLQFSHPLIMRSTSHKSYKDPGYRARS